MGQTLLELADVDWSHGRLVSFKMKITISKNNLAFLQNLNADLQKFVNLNDLPELLLSVCYNATLLRLTVNVVEGKNFKVIELPWTKNMKFDIKVYISAQTCILNYPNMARKA